MRLTRPQRVGDAEEKPLAPTRPQRGAGQKDVVKTTPFRPLYRPPMLLIGVLDDDGADAEWIRVRGDRFIIGRADGDFRIPHEAGMSGRHLEFVREEQEGEFFWTVRDLDTTNGTFARVEEARLRHGWGVLLGSRPYRFDAAPQGAGMAAEEPTETSRNATKGWHVLAAAGNTASLVLLTRQGDGERYPLEADEQWIGTDGLACRIAIQADRYLDPKHARIFRKGQQWWIEDGKSTNGTWVSVKKVRIEGAAEIRVGEQRFKLRVP